MGEKRCPVCDCKFDPAVCQVMPFCSERCRRIDRGRWLSEQYVLPLQRDEEDREVGEGFDEEAGPTDAD